MNPSASSNSTPNALRWLLLCLAAVLFVVAVAVPGSDGSPAEPLVAMTSVDVESVDLDMDLPALREPGVVPVTAWPEARHESVPAERVVTRPPAPPDRPPSAA